LIEKLQSDSNFQAKSERVLDYLTKVGDVRNATQVLLELGSVKRLSQFLQEENVSRTIDSSIQDSIMRSAVQEIRDWIPVTKWSGESGEIARTILNFYSELLSGNFPLANSYVAALRDAVNSLDKTSTDNWTVDLLAIESISHYAQGRLEDSFQCAIAAMEISTKKVNSLRHHQLTFVQVALWAAVISDDDNKVRMIQDFLNIALKKDSLKSRSSSIQSLLSLIAAFQGRIIEARNLYVAPISKNTFEYYEGFFANYGVHMAQSLVNSESGNLKKSISILEEAIESSRKSKNFPILIAFLGRISYMYFLESEIEKSLACISEAREIIHQNSLSEELHACVDIWEMRVRYLLKDHERARELLKRTRNTYLARAFAAAIEINVNPKKALQLIDTFDLDFPRQKLTYHLFRAHIFSDNPRAQVDEVKKAVEVGSKHGYFHHFLTQRSDVIQQYISLAAEYPTAFNERLARAAGEKLNEMMVGNQSTGESLTRREADILRHLATGLPLHEIAGNLNISKNTIKTHLKNLYRKLGAKNREDAVEKGKKLLKV
jgi:ATP/maltotriose-dependent transcriptional regulator MalT